MVCFSNVFTLANIVQNQKSMTLTLCLPNQKGVIIITAHTYNLCILLAVAFELKTHMGETVSTEQCNFIKSYAISLN